MLRLKCGGLITNIIGAANTTKIMTIISSIQMATYMYGCLGYIGSVIRAITGRGPMENMSIIQISGRINMDL
jgi:hypothetical protein